MISCGRVLLWWEEDAARSALASSGCIGFAKQAFAAKEAVEVAMEEKAESKKSVRKRANEIKPFRCKHLIAVLENPTDVKNIGR